MDENSRKTDIEHQLMYMNNKLGRIEDRLENMEKIQELQAEDLREHIRRTNILEERIMNFDFRHQKTLDTLNAYKDEVSKQLEKANKKQTKFLLPGLTIVGGIITLIVEIIKHFWG